MRRHVAELTRVVTRLLGPCAEVDDVIQDTLVLALEKLDGLREPAAFKGWMIRIGVNEARRVFRRRRLRRLVGLDETVQSPQLAESSLTGLEPELRAELALIDEMLRKLSSERRIAWTLRYVEGYSLPEVADACDCSLATAKRRIAAAHRFIKAAARIKEGDHV